VTSHDAGLGDERLAALNGQVSKWWGTSVGNTVTAVATQFVYDNRSGRFSVSQKRTELVRAWVCGFVSVMRRPAWGIDCK